MVVTMKRVTIYITVILLLLTTNLLCSELFCARVMATNVLPVSGYHNARIPSIALRDTTNHRVRDCVSVGRANLTVYCLIIFKM